jgi:hypothetical protein
MLKVEKRYRKDCRYSQYDRAHAKCTCAYRAIGILNGVFVRRSLKTSNEQVRSYQAHLFTEKKLATRTVAQRES